MTDQPFTQLKDYKLWYDGSISVNPSYLVQYFLTHGSTNNRVFVDEITPDVVNYNKMVPLKERMTVKSECASLSHEWNIPEEYKSLDVESYVLSKLEQHKNEERWSDKEFERRLQRVAAELALYKRKKLYDVLRTIIFVINTLTTHQVVWGVGRGSSVSSYVLYLIGTHDVDSVKYRLNIEDFIS